MLKKCLIAFCAVVAIVVAADLNNASTWQSTTCQAAMQARNDGTYSATNQYVTIYNESGACKGQFRVYLHKGDRYINFQNDWIRIEGKRRFGHNGNWYIIK